MRVERRLTWHSYLQPVESIAGLRRLGQPFHSIREMSLAFLIQKDALVSQYADERQVAHQKLVTIWAQQFQRNL